MFYSCHFVLLTSVANANHKDRLDRLITVSGSVVQCVRSIAAAVRCEQSASFYAKYPQSLINSRQFYKHIIFLIFLDHHDVSLCSTRIPQINAGGSGATQNVHKSPHTFVHVLSHRGGR